MRRLSHPNAEVFNPFVRDAIREDGPLPRTVVSNINR